MLCFVHNEVQLLWTWEFLIECNLLFQFHWENMHMCAFIHSIFTVFCTWKSNELLCQQQFLAAINGEHRRSVRTESHSATLWCIKWKWTIIEISSYAVFCKLLLPIAQAICIFFNEINVRRWRLLWWFFLSSFPDICRRRDASAYRNC